MKTSFKTWALRMGLGSFVDINILVFSFFIFSIFVESHKSKSTQMLDPKKKTREFRSTILFKISGSGVHCVHCSCFVYIFFVSWTIYFILPYICTALYRLNLFIVIALKKT